MIEREGLSMEESQGQAANAESSEHVGVVNPYALTEVRLGRKVNWKRVSSPQRLVEETLGVPYTRLFDPKYGDSPLYPGLSVDMATQRAVVTGTATRAVGVRGVTWADPGRFYAETAEVTDPIQGAVGNCYLISALGALAWSRPYMLVHRTRATGPAQENFVDVIGMYRFGVLEYVEVSEKLPVQGTNNALIYARSSEAGEIWPGIYEKAYAKFITKDPGDQPDITRTAYGLPGLALAYLTGLPLDSRSMRLFADGHAVWEIVRSQAIGQKIYNPMVAWTYPTAPSSSVNYSSAHLVANHAYTVLGWAMVNNQEYLVLRNPWGAYEGTLNVLGGEWVAWDQPYYNATGWWRPIQFSTNDGVFALRSDTFHQYFAGVGWVKAPESP
jgi:hypothetical protein